MIHTIFISILLQAFSIYGLEKFEHLIPENLQKLSKDGHANSIAIKQGIEDYNEPISTETSTFLDLVQKSKLFIDNTLLIAEILRNIHLRPELIVGPKKWGKSVNLDMIKTFIQLQVDQQGNQLPRNSTVSYKLFANGEIVVDDGHVDKLQHPLRITSLTDVVSQIQGQYPVIHVSFKDVAGEDYEALKDQMRIAISRTYQQHDYLIKIIEKEFREARRPWYQQKDLQNFQHYLNHSDSVEIEDSLTFLCKLLHHQFGKIIFVLVDDYDTPIHSILRYSKYPEDEIENTIHLVMGLMQSVLNKTCKNHRGVITGTFSLDNEEGRFDWVYPDQGEYIANVKERFHEYFGFRQTLVKFLLQKINVDHDLSQKACKWYDGYKSDQHFYHPSSIVRFLKYKQIDHYQGEHWTDEFMKKILRLQPEYRDALLSLISEQTTAVSARFSYSNVTIRQLKQLSLSHTHDRHIVSECISDHLLGLGYLTRLSDKAAKIPNREISFEVSTWIMSYFTQHYRIDDKHLQDAATDLHRLIQDQSNAVTSLEGTLTQVYQHSSETTKHKEKVVKDLMTRSIFNTIVLQLQRSSKFHIDAYYNKIRSADVVIIENQIRRVAIVEITYGNDGPEIALKAAEKYQHVAKDFTDIKSVQLIGIQISLKKAAYIATKTIAVNQTTTATSKV